MLLRIFIRSVLPLFGFWGRQDDERLQWRKLLHLEQAPRQGEGLPECSVTLIQQIWALLQTWFNNYVTAQSQYHLPYARYIKIVCLQMFNLKFLETSTRLRRKYCSGIAMEDSCLKLNAWGVGYIHIVVPSDAWVGKPRLQQIAPKCFYTRPLKLKKTSVEVCYKHWQQPERRCLPSSSYTVSCNSCPAHPD